MTLTEAEAWSVVNKTPARQQYEHVTAYAKRLKQHQRFISQIVRKPDQGCWLWTGSRIVNPSGVVTPVFHEHLLGKNLKSDTRTEAAFTRIVRQWFPTQYAKGLPTTTSCNNHLCISPVHRYYDVNAKFHKKLTPTDVLGIYRLRYTVRAEDLAERYGVGRNAIFKIWSGDTWSNVTGARKKCRSKAGTAAGGAESPTGPAS